MPRRPSPQTEAVIGALAADPAAWRHGYDLLKALDLKAGTLYPILMRLCDRGVLEATWEADPPPGRPPRHLYRLKGGVAPAPRPEPGMVTRDLAARGLAFAVRALPAERRDWGLAMQAELAVV